MRCLLTITMTLLSLVLPAMGKPAPVVLQYWEKWTGDEAAAMQEVVDAFNASQDRIRVEMTSVSQIDQKLLLAVLSGNPPDIAGLWAPFTAPYAERGLINPLNELVEETGYDLDRFDPAFLSMCRHRGALWALPSSSLALLLYWNPDLFEAAGLDPARPPRTLEELHKFNGKLTQVEIKRDGETVTVPFDELTDAERAGRDYRIVRIGFDPTMGYFWIPYWSYWFGGRIVDNETGRLLLDDPGMTSAIEWYHAFFLRFGLTNVRSFGASYMGSNLGSFASSSNPFFSGRAAMVINGPWLPRFAEEYAPGLRWDAAEFPTGEGGRTLVDTDILVIPRGTSHEREAFEFLRFVNSRDVSETLNMRQSKMTPLTNPSDRYLESHPNRRIDVFHEIVANGRAWPILQTPIFSRLISDLYTAYDLSSADPKGTLEFLEETQQRLETRNARAAEKWDARRDMLLQRGTLR